MRYPFWTDSSFSSRSSSQTSPQSPWTWRLSMSMIRCWCSCSVARAAEVIVTLPIAKRGSRLRAGDWAVWVDCILLSFSNSAVHESKAVTHERTIAKIWQVACSGGLTKYSSNCFCDRFFNHGWISIWNMQAMAQADMAREGLKRIHKEPRAMKQVCKSYLEMLCFAISVLCKVKRWLLV